jgi:hypothetical protein
MPPRKKANGESKVGLVVTLVFFILATLGLGVATYYGFAEQTTLTDAKTKAVKDLADMKAERDWYRIQANICRAYFDNPPTNDTHAEEMRTGKAEIDKFIRDKAGKTPGDNQKDKDEVIASLGKLNKDMPWDASRDKLPPVTVKTLQTAAATQYQALEKTNDALKAQVTAAQAAQREAEETLKKKVQEFDAGLKNVSTTAETEREKGRKQIDDARAAADSENKAKEKESVEKANTQKNLETMTARAAKAESEVNRLKQERKELNDVIDETKGKLTLLLEKQKIDARALEAEALDAKALQTLKTWNKDWKIVMMDRQGNMPYVNLGSADKVVPQLTFSVHAVGVDGKLAPTPKGTLEIVKVVGPNLSRARVTSVKNASADPILTGDRLFNPTWDPNVKKHVAVVGIIDLHGDGRDNTADFLRQLERQGVVIDAYLDTKDFKVKGKGITINTDYVIVGDQLDSTNDPRARDRDLSSKVEKEIQKMRAAAIANGVNVIGYRKYMDLAGMREGRGGETAGGATGAGGYR